MRAVIVVELDLPDDPPDALREALDSLGEPKYGVRFHAAIREPADRVLAVFTNDKEGDDR